MTKIADHSGIKRYDVTRLEIMLLPSLWSTLLSLKFKEVINEIKIKTHIENNLINITYNLKKAYRWKEK